MADLVLGPLLRYAGRTDATIWVETDAPCEVEVLGCSSPTFQVGGRHYAIVLVEGLECGSITPYEVRLDGRPVWPEPDSPFPPSRINTFGDEEPLRIVFGSCRTAHPQHLPYVLPKDRDPRGRDIDALRTYALRMAEQDETEWPHLVLMLGDQVYADELPPRTEELVKRRRDVSEPPGLEATDFDEYVSLYHEAWGEPVVRWLLSTVPSAMIFDDHDVRDDWNISAAWRAEIEATSWWDDRISSGFASYWIYQHLGNLSPAEIREQRLLEEVRQDEDGLERLLAFGLRADRHVEGVRWSFHRDLGATRLVVIDSRAGRVLGDDRASEKDRRMIDEAEREWVEATATGDHDHLLVASSLPLLMQPGLHELESWNEAVCCGAWTRLASGTAERIRQAVDLEHWPAFRASFDRLVDHLRAVATGEHGRPPASIVVLSGDVHHGYLAEVGWPKGLPVESAVYQAVSSPFRNGLDAKERRIVRFASSRAGHLIGRALARSARVPEPAIRWRNAGDGPFFGNLVGSMVLDGRHGRLRLEQCIPGEWEHPRLRPVIDRAIA